MLKKVLLIFIVIILSVTTSYSEDRDHYLLKEVKNVLEQEFKQTHYKETLIITNAGQVKFKSKDTINLLSILSNYADMSLGNIINIHDSVNSSLFIFVYDSLLDKAVYIKDQNNSLSFQSFEKFLTTSLNNTEDKVKNLLNGRGYKFLPIVVAWKKGMSLELRNSVQFHDHLCPGVLSGLWISKYLLESFPLSSEQRYLIVSIPSWCKDDAIQSILNTTAGKRNLLVIPISEKSKKCLVDGAMNLAGIYIRYSPKKKEAEALVIEFLWDELRKDAGVKEGKTFQERLKLIEWMVENEKDYKRYVRPLKTKTLDNFDPESFFDVDMNILKSFDLWKCN